MHSPLVYYSLIFIAVFLMSPFNDRRSYTDATIACLLGGLVFGVALGLR